MSYLPHIYPVEATFFITFRLADSLPQHKIDSLKEEFNKKKRKSSTSKFRKRKRGKPYIAFKRKYLEYLTNNLMKPPSELAI